MKKSLAWTGTLSFLLISLLFLYFALQVNKRWAIVLSSTLTILYLIGLLILIIDYFQTRKK